MVVESCCGFGRHLRMNLPPNLFFRDASDDCRVGFTPREHAVGARSCSLDGALVRLLEAYTPEYLNGHSRALYHCGQQDSSEKVGGEWALVKTLPS